MNGMASTLAQHGIRTPLGTRAIVKTIIKGLVVTQQNLAEIIWRKPILSFVSIGQVMVNEKGELIPFEVGEGKITNVEIEFHFQIDPKAINPAMQNRISAIRERVNAAQKVTETMFKASGQMGNVDRKVTWDDLPDTDMLTDLFGEQEDAYLDRLLACVMKDSSGYTMWDYVDATGEVPLLTKQFLQENPSITLAMLTSFNAWLFPTNNSSGATTKTTTTSGEKDTTAKTPDHSSSDSHGHSTPAEQTEMTGQNGDTSQNGMSG